MRQPCFSQLLLALSLSLLASLGAMALPDGAKALAQSTARLSSQSLGLAANGSASRPLPVVISKGRSQLLSSVNGQGIARVAIADPNLADVVPIAPNQLMLNAKQRGVTSLIMWSQQGQATYYELRVENDTSELMKAIEALSPGEALQVRVTDDSVVVSGQASNSVILDEIRQLAGAYGYRDAAFVNLTETATPQVSLKVRIAELNRSVGKELKIGLGLNSDNLAVTKLDSFLPTNPINIGQLPIANINRTGGFLGATGFQPFTNLDVQARFDLLETQGKLKTLAEPTLLCTHGRTASFVAGGEFPFVSGVGVNGVPTIEFKEFGVKLMFTPWIATRTGRVEMRVMPEVSSIDTTLAINTQGNQIFGLATRKTDTTVDLADGQSLVISGLLSREEQNTLSQIPYAGNLPVIGPLFRNRSGSNSERELIIIVTPTIIQPPTSGV